MIDNKQEKDFFESRLKYMTNIRVHVHIIFICEA